MAVYDPADDPGASYSCSVAALKTGDPVGAAAAGKVTVANDLNAVAAAVEVPVPREFDYSLQFYRLQLQQSTNIPYVPFPIVEIKGTACNVPYRARTHTWAREVYGGGDAHADPPKHSPPP